MRLAGRIVHYFIVTGIIWGWYAVTLPLWLYYVIGLTWDQIVLWWWQGTIIEMALAYPIGLIMMRVKTPIYNFCEKI